MKFAREIAFWVLLLTFGVGLNECLDALTPPLVEHPMFVLPAPLAIVLMFVGVIGILLLGPDPQPAEKPNA
jgi:hypothetical protein